MKIIGVKAGIVLQSCGLAVLQSFIYLISDTDCKTAGLHDRKTFLLTFVICIKHLAS